VTEPKEGSVTREAFDLFVVGLGTVGVSQLTREAEQALARSSEILFLDDRLGVAEHLATLCPRVTDLRGCYQPGENRIDAFERIVTRALEASLERPPVSFAVQGHPCVGVFPTQHVLAAAAALGLRCKVLPGISSIDAMLVDLGLDPGIAGLQVYDATDVLLRRRPLQSDVPCMVLDVASVGNAGTLYLPPVTARAVAYGALAAALDAG
jgi:uncharacterized protein YabN with tetrapyrrole methylase and pyrophosphatase domain